MKLFGLACGRKMGNCEILLKEAMMGAEDVGAEVEIVRMRDLDIRPCLWCQPCPVMTKRNIDECIIKDDAPFFLEKFLDCDGFIISAPVYTKTPPGQLLLIRDRLMGPKVDMSVMRGQPQTGQQAGPQISTDERLLKIRSGGFMSVGGAPNPDWVTLGMPLLHSMTFSAQVAIVDQVQFLRIAAPGAAALYEDVLSRARILGRRVAEAMGKPYEEAKYEGDEPGVCPVCHTNLMVMGNNRSVMCATCGITGTIEVDGDNLTVVFSEEEQKKSHMTVEGKRLHGLEIREVAQALEPRKDEIPEKVKKYQSYKAPLKPPRKSNKKSGS